MTRPALADVLAVACCDTHCAGWWRAEIAAGMRVGCDSRGASTPTAAVPWAHATPADALAALDARGLIPEHWCDPERAPRWWCEGCEGTGYAKPRSADDIDPYTGASVWRCSACGSCAWRGATDAPPSHAALVVVASIGVDALARAEAIVAETWRARVVWRVMTAEEIREHHKKHCASTDVTPALVFSREMTPPLTNFEWRPVWPEVCPFVGGFGTPDDDRHGVHRAWPALRALAALGLHLLAVDGGRVTLGVEAL